MSKGHKWLLLWLGGIGLAAIAVVVVILSTCPCSRERSRRINCLNNLKQIGLALKMYAADHKDLYPDELVKAGKYVARQSSLFICFSSGNEAGEFRAVDDWTDYVYLVPHAGAPSNAVILYCPAKNHGWEYGNILFADGHAATVRSVTSKVYSDNELSFEDVLRTIKERRKR